MTSPSTINGQFVGLDEGEKREKNKINAHHLNKDFEYLICFFVVSVLRGVQLRFL